MVLVNPLLSKIEIVVDFVPTHSGRCGVQLPPCSCPFVEGRVNSLSTLNPSASDAGRRDVEIPPHLLPAIKDHLERFVGPQKDALLFPAAHGGHLAPASLYRQFYKARSVAKRDDLRWHDLRHSGAVLAAATGATLAELMARLGHSTPGAAMRYQHAAQGRDRQIAKLLSKLADTPM
jgi:integrase